MSMRALRNGLPLRGASFARFWRHGRCGRMESPKTKVRPLFEALASPPSFRLPPASLGHTRHYMRWYKNKKRPQDQTLVFDAFVCVGRGTDKDSEVLVFWPDAALGARQRGLLSDLLERFGYLGRAESWCEAQLIEDELAGGQINCRPLGRGEALASGQEVVRVLCPDPETALSGEHVRGVRRQRKKTRIRSRLESGGRDRATPCRKMVGSSRLALDDLRPPCGLLSSIEQAGPQEQTQSWLAGRPLRLGFDRSSARDGHAAVGRKSPPRADGLHAERRRPAPPVANFLGQRRCRAPACRARPCVLSADRRGRRRGGWIT